MRPARSVFLVVTAALVWSAVPALAALPDTSNPQLQLERTIRTTPFMTTSTSMRDGEGGTYVPSDNSLWLADDNGRAIYEVNPATGALKRVINRSAFEAAPRFGGGAVAGASRTGDFESMAYDATQDDLLLFSGPCCTASNLPTAFRLTRPNPTSPFQVESYQPLASGSDHTAAAFNSGDGKVYVAKGASIRSYDYANNSLGPILKVTNLAGILGLSFSPGGQDLIAVTNAERLIRANWASKTIVPGWNLDLLPFGVLDSRAVSLLPDDKFYVLDGADTRPAGDPLKYAVFVFSVAGSTPTPPTASFTANPASGEVPLSVSFNNTSTGNPTPTWDWDFGDGTTPHSTERDPTHVYNSAGTYTVTLTATSTEGTSQATATITVTEPQPNQDLVGNPGFETDTSGWGITGSGAGVALTRVTSPVHSGSGAALLRNNSTGTRKCVLNDVPNWVTTTSAGPYTGSIWVQGATAGKKIKITFRELNSGGSLVGSRVVTYTLGTSWHQLSITYTPVQAGTSTLDLQVFVPKDFAPPGVCFYADDASILGP